MQTGANLVAFAKTTAFQSGVCSILANLITQAEDLRDLRLTFVSWDTNKDGSLTTDELQHNMAEISAFFNLDEPDIHRMMKAADVNNDGHIDYTEFITAAFDKQKLLSEEKVRQAFDLFDTDEDGGISTDELRATFDGSGSANKGNEFWEEVMQQVD